MGRVAILQANLGNFDTPQDPVEQKTDYEVTFHRFTDDNFPPITGLTGRLQYRIPKTHGWDMFPDYDYYIWLDGSVSLKRDDCVEYYLNQLGDNDMGFFAHPDRQTVTQEVQYIEDYIDGKAGKRPGQQYMRERYLNGRHREFLDMILEEGYEDNTLWATTMFIYRNTEQVRKALADWWYLGSLYFTCDQVQLPFIAKKHELSVATFDEPIYKSGYLSLVSKHR